jgi:transmembrane sensor
LINQPEEKLLLLAEMQQYDVQDALRKVNRKIDRKQRGWMPILQRIAAAMLIPVLLGSVSYIIYLHKQVSPLETVWQTVETLPGQRSFLKLPDGTSVWLNSATKLTYPATFSRNSREVKLDGEAFFDVTRMEHRPFNVDIGDIRVKVLGTEFNVNNYKEDEDSHIYLKSGLIELHSNSDNEERMILSLDPGERAVYHKDEKKLTLLKGQSDVCLAWLEGKMVFRDDPMTEVVRKLNRYFNAEITIANPEIREYTYTATFQDESLEQILELLKISAPINYKIDKRERNEVNMFTKNRVELYTR